MQNPSGSPLWNAALTKYRNVRRSLLIVPLIGTALSMAVAGVVGLVMPPGIGRVAASWLVGALGIALTAFVFWRATGEFADDSRRAGVVAVLAFIGVHDQAWIGLLRLESWHAKISADFALTCGAFIVAMYVYSVLPPRGAVSRSNAAEQDAKK